MFKPILYFFIGYLMLSGNEAQSQEQSKPLFRFGIIADVQYADKDNNNTRHYRSSLKKLADAVEVLNKEDVRFVMSLGDFIEDDFKSFDTLNSITSRLTMPLYHVLGNHDFSVAPDKKDEVLDVLDLKRDYYSFKQKKWRFIILNGNDISLLANDEGSEKYRQADSIYTRLKEAGSPNAKPWNGTLGAAQMTWLKMELDKAEQKNEQIILFCHFPLYPDKSPHTLWNTVELRKLVEGYPNVKAYFNGHTHVSQYYFESDVNYVSFRGMVEKEENAFAIVSVYKDRLEIKGYGAEVNRTIK